MIDMHFEEDELHLYDEYLMFIRRLIIDQLQLDIQDPYELDIEVSELLTDGIRFLFYSNVSNSYVEFTGIHFNMWLKMLERDKKITELLKRK